MANLDDRDRSAKRPWWVDALDPAENLRTLANVQDFGRLAAEELADRLLPGDDGPGGRPRVVADTELDQLVRRLQTEVLRAGEAWINLVEIFAAMAGVLTSRLAGRAGGGPAGGPAPVRMEAIRPGAEVTGVFYVHNTAPVPVPAARPHCARLRSHLGQELAGDVVRFEPQLLEPLPARSSCGIEVRACVPPGTAPGTYLSVILVSNVPELYLPLELTVAAAEAEG
jgi:hypothetical protein